MESSMDIDLKLLLQPVEPGATLPENISGKGLFLLNLTKIVGQDIWDDLGTKEQLQAEQVRKLASHLSKMADLLEELGLYLSALPDPYDYENGDYEQTWDEINEEADSQITGDYRKLDEILEELADDAVGDFMD